MPDTLVVERGLIMPKGQRTSPSASTILLMDVISAWEAVEEDHGIKLKCELTRGSGSGSGQLNACIRVTETPNEDGAELDISTYWAWPTHHHKTFLGMVLWLLHQIDSEVTAQRALAQQPLFPPKQP